MKALLTSLILFLSLEGAAQAAPMPQHPDINPDLLSRMILDTALIYCKQQQCVRMDTQQPHPGGASFMDGYWVAWLSDNYTAAQMDQMAEPLSEYYKIYLEQLEREQ